MLEELCKLTKEVHMTQNLRTHLHAQAKNIKTVNGSHSTFIL